MKDKICRKYRETQINTADKGTLLLMLYEGAILELNRLKQLLERSKFDRMEFSDHMVRAQNIIIELMGSLNLDDPRTQPIAENLWRIYEYLIWRLMMADLRKDADMINEVMWHLQSLKEAWEAVINEKRETAEDEHALSSLVA
ncbi:TPA: flagellar export chaperone FliS [Candidatus Poribacteria bacterium]|nr:flagellar export chaperone FliS [Candidatus Poribacteria bacterium]